MKKIHAGLIIAIVASVFVISFLVGRATILKKISEEDKTITYSGFVPVPEKEESTETAKKTEKVPDITPRTKKVEEIVAVPQRMLFPCGETVVKEYSQTAVYSETMGDWRAHTGIDYGADVGSEVVSVWNGKVSRVHKDKLWGYTVEILHAGDIVSVYKNLDENITVSEGQTVESGQVIGYVGRSADIEALEVPHLHFEMWKNGLTVNPTSYVY